MENDANQINKLYWSRKKNTILIVFGFKRTKKWRKSNTKLIDELLNLPFHWWVPGWWQLARPCGIRWPRRADCGRPPGRTTPKNPATTPSWWSVMLLMTKTSAAISLQLTCGLILSEIVKNNAFNNNESSWNMLTKSFRNRAKKIIPLFCVLSFCFNMRNRNDINNSRNEYLNEIFKDILKIRFQNYKTIL